MQIAILFFTLIISSSAMASMASGESVCPQKFEAKVKEIIEPVGSTQAFAINTVVFENLRNIRGNTEQQVFLEILQNGPFKAEKGKDYLVQIRNGKLCWMEEI